MSVEPRVVRRAAVCRRDFLLGSAALSAALLLPGTGRAEVRQLAGNVRVNGKRATGKTRVGAGDTVETGTSSKLVFVIGRDAFLLREKSKSASTKSAKAKARSFPSQGGDGRVAGSLRPGRAPHPDR